MAKKLTVGWRKREQAAPPLCVYKEQKQRSLPVKLSTNNKHHVEKQKQFQQQTSVVVLVLLQLAAVLFTTSCTWTG